jgi:hypothetical protein
MKGLAVARARAAKCTIARRGREWQAWRRSQRVNRMPAKDRFSAERGKPSGLGSSFGGDIAKLQVRVPR